MVKRTKEEKRYIIINTILLLISLILISYICLLIKGNKETIINGYENTVNILVSTLQVESSNTELIETIENKEYILPTIDDNIQSNEEYDFNEINNNKYYYSQLNDNSKLIYDTIEKNLNNMKSGTYKIKLPNSVADVLKYSNGDAMLDSNFQSAWDALSLDRVDIFFIDVSKINLSIKKTTYGNNVSYSLSIVPSDETGYLEEGLTGADSVNLLLNKVKNVRDKIISNTAGDRYSKILQVHDWIIENIEYSLDIQNENIYNLYGALIDRVAVCEGYAESFKYALDALEIPCILVSGTATNSNGATESHAWNYVQIEGRWYAVDTTWDDPVVKGYGYISNSTKHKYFLQGAKTINENHTTKGKFTETGQEFTYPELEKNAYQK